MSSTTPVGVVHAFGLREHVPVQSHQPNEISLTGEQLGLEPMQGRRQGRSPVPPASVIRSGETSGPLTDAPHR